MDLKVKEVKEYLKLIKLSYRILWPPIRKSTNLPIQTRTYRFIIDTDLMQLCSATSYR